MSRGKTSTMTTDSNYLNPPYPASSGTLAETIMAEDSQWMEEDSEAASYDDYDLGDFTRQEIESYNRMASPASRLKRKARVLEDEVNSSENDESITEVGHQELPWSGEERREILDKPEPRYTRRAAQQERNQRRETEKTGRKKSVPISPFLDQCAGQVTPPATPSPRPRKRRSKGPTKSPYFATPAPPTPSKKTSPSKKNISCIPFPPLASATFGLVQERLANQPFRLLIAVIFLNKTRGAVALPVFFELMQRYPTVQALADAKHEDVVGILQHLGLQNARARKIVGLAKTWLVAPPEMGKRYRCLHYPCRGDGKDVRADECVPDESQDPRVGWEIAHLPGIGVYGLDSWRIFCRDTLREMEGGKEEDGEWTRVLPLDKELRAYLRWRWMKLGWTWDPTTGNRKRAGDDELRANGAGGVIIEGDEG